MINLACALACYFQRDIFGKHREGFCEPAERFGLAKYLHDDDGFCVTRLTLPLVIFHSQKASPILIHIFDRQDRHTGSLAEPIGRNTVRLTAAKLRWIDRLDGAVLLAHCYSSYGKQDKPLLQVAVSGARSA